MKGRYYVTEARALVKQGSLYDLFAERQLTSEERLIQAFLVLAFKDLLFVRKLRRRLDKLTDIEICEIVKNYNSAVDFFLMLDGGKVKVAAEKLSNGLKKICVMSCYNCDKRMLMEYETLSFIKADEVSLQGGYIRDVGFVLTDYKPVTCSCGFRRFVGNAYNPGRQKKSLTLQNKEVYYEDDEEA